MTEPQFVHLHTHSEYSLLDGMNRPAELCERVKERGMNAVALTDHGNLFGALKFFQAAKKAEVKPIIGCELYVAPGSRKEKKGGERYSNYHLVLLAKDLDGYRNLMKLSSIAYTEGFYYKPRIDLELLSQHSKGLIGLSGCLKGIPPQAILHPKDPARADEELDAAIDRFVQILGKENYFLEIMDHGMPEQKVVQAKLLETAGRHQLAVVATNDAHYPTQEDSIAHDILLCIGTGKLVSDERRMRYSSDQYYIKSPQEMAALFPHVPEALSNTVRVAEMCNLELPLDQQLYPSFKPPDGMDCEVYLRQLSEAGLSDRMKGNVPERYHKQLLYELGVIHNAGFDAYFLITWDFVNYARKNNIAVGPGRGSGAGCIVAWALGITDLDPLHHGLFFERFLNPERISPPDFDIDFCVNRRKEVIDYVKSAYGAANVAYIGTFNTMKAKAALRDVGRVLETPLSEVDRLAKMIPDGPKMTLESALKDSPEFKRAYNSDASVRELIDKAQKVEGLHRNPGVHAAGIVITDQPMDTLVPVFKQTNSDDTVTQFEMGDITKLGLLKCDFLGLKNLTIIELARDLIRENHGVEIEWDELGFDDAPTYQMVAKGQTLGVFQLESSGMRGVCQRLKPTCFTDAAAVIALFRPGPMKNIDRFIDNKHGRQKIEYLDPLLEPILKETYGIIVYQEQVSLIANKLAGFSLGEADVLRAAMGKKKEALMQQMAPKFVQGCVDNGIAEQLASKIWSLMKEFAEYGFNKAHTISYAVIAFRTAYLKAHYPIEFLSALMTHDMGNLEKMPVYLQEARDMELKVLGIDINHSEAEFRPEGGDIRFGMAAVKNVGRAAIEAIVKERSKHGPFASFMDLCERVDQRALNSRMIEALIRVGAFDQLGLHRAQLLECCGEACELAAQQQEERRSGQASLFDTLDADQGGGSALGRMIVPKIPQWNNKEALENEKELIGCYMSGHPLENHRADGNSFANCDAIGLEDMPDEQEVVFMGIINRIIKRVDRNNREFAFVEMEDFTGAVEITFFSDAYEKSRRFLQPDAVLLVFGGVNEFNGAKKIRAERAEPAEQVRLAQTREVLVTLEAAQYKPDFLQVLEALAAAHPGPCPLMFTLEHPEGGAFVLQSASPKKITPDQDFLQEIANLGITRPLRFMR